MILPTDGSTFPNQITHFLNDRDAALKAGQPWEPKSVGAFDLYPDGFYVQRGVPLPDKGGNPIILHCDDNKRPEALVFSSTHDLPNGLRVRTFFNTTQVDLDQTALAADQAVVELLQDLAAK